MFCTKCGNPLEEGQKCACQQSHLKTAREIFKTEVKVFQEVNSTNIKLFLLENLYTFFEFIKSPTIVIKRCAKKQDIADSIFFLSLQALLSGFFLILVTMKLDDFASDLLGVFSFLWEAKISYFTIFIKTVLYVFLLFILFNFVLYLFSNVLFKGEGNFKGLVSTLGIIAIPKIITLWLSFILILISFKFVLCLNFMTYIFGMILNFVAVKEVFGFSEDKSAYALAFSYLLYFILIVVFIF